MEATPKSVVSRPRFHHQYLPDTITFESDAFSASQIEKLESMGHQFAVRKGAYGEENPVYGNMQAVIRNKRAGKVEAA